MCSPLNAFILFLGIEFSFSDIRKNKRNVSFFTYIFCNIVSSKLKIRTDEIQF